MSANGTFTFGDKTVEMPIKKGTIGPEVVDIGKLYNATGCFTFDPGFDATGVPPIDEMGSGFYFKSSGPVLMVSPGDQTPSVPCDAQPEEYDLAVAVDQLETLTTLKVERMKARWAGLRTFTSDEHPVAGFDTAESSFFWLVGQGGGGIMSASGLGDLSARLITGADLPIDGGLTAR